MHFAEFLSGANGALIKDVSPLPSPCNFPSPFLCYCEVSMSNPKNNILMTETLEHNVTA